MDSFDQYVMAAYGSALIMVIGLTLRTLILRAQKKKFLEELKGEMLQ